MAKERESDRKTARARELVGIGAVKLEKGDVTGDGEGTFQAVVMDDRAKTTDRMDVALSLDADGRVTSAECTCSDFKHNKLRKGPCQHILAVAMSTATQIPGMVDE